MLSARDNAMLTQTGAGTPMGEVFRRFWIPALLSEELPAPDSVPVRVELLGEKLVAFRDTEGRVGLMDAYCPHRGAPMFFGRNEDCGLRCVYHGWKFDVEGNCVELPNAPEGETYKHKVKIDAYPTWEAAGIVWAYLGPKDRQPPLPDFEWVHLPKGHTYITKYLLNCNFMQGEEGDFDTSHAQFLHSTLDGNRSNPASAVGQFRINAIDAMPRYEFLEEKDYGVMFVGVTPLPDGKNKQINVGHWFLPSSATAGIAGPGIFSSNWRIPINDEWCWMYRLRWSDNPIPDSELALYKRDGYIYPEQIPGQYQAKENKANDYLIDRLAQKHYSYTGIKSFPIQDIAMIEDQRGPIQDRTKEHLVSSDSAIIKVRQFMLRTAKDLMEGVEPVGASKPSAYRVRNKRATVPVEKPTAEVLAEMGFTVDSAARV